ncbi:NADPH:quinone reductase and related Zn-dependent oxidoreductase [Amycolatopsis mediterranei S699]|uniref:NADPH:quinone reductase and related Zn-dependent oxidoreductase n=2 Tax=Amycolatopsis mediterranei TaxID=33910 RepID=A0A0H3CYP0_AMYMU|nr:NADP-dependent oxidoreductase [Amycolatopsis mediterranei]ADJ43468.1 NADPH:quinone reductase and related Zn-dependent oxidoreductase [Amycolatopsis mediterranei U32]AEK40174.1 NADPH:quinone reductase and related Zn-dependent oxidoreductase [Amycolatopsis mediterranei S699]AFO75181.1 NADPH:quinone reductase and related Zn-dependent oxidoreductase [Amycolatopsis mediterranei S699]AGT82310.1 NADPH:quinone reductase-related Zn-dependent oxidoreductase [Amycolatopsis mediterranei RB]KDO11626.1 N
MRAITFSAYGGPEVLQLSDVPAPEPGPGQVRLAVRAAAVNPIDWKIRNGAMQQNFQVPFPHIPGVEVAGVVDAVGEGADFAVGDEVFGWSETGAYAEYALAKTIAPKPASLSWADAAALPVAGETALRVLGLLGVREGETLLLLGASGTVGRFAAQVALAQGVTVIGTGGSRSLDDLKSLGVVPVRYGDGWVERVREVTSGPVDAVFDAAGHGVLPGSVELRGTKDRIITIADAAAFELGIPFSSGGEQTREVLTGIAGWVTDRGVGIAQGKSYPLAEAAAAQVESEGGHPGGKVTIAVG